MNRSRSPQTLPVRLLAVALLSAANTAWADDPPEARTREPSAGAVSAAPSRAGDTAPNRPKDPPLPEKALPPDEPPPSVVIRNVKGTLIEEYRQGTRLYMIRVVPERGVPYTYIDTDGDGRLQYDGEDGPVRPVYYTLYEWD